MTDREREYRADLKRIEQIKQEIEKLRLEKVKLVQRNYYYEHRDEKLKRNKKSTQNNKNS